MASSPVRRKYRSSQPILGVFGHRHNGRIAEPARGFDRVVMLASVAAPIDDVLWARMA